MNVSKDNSKKNITNITGGIRQLNELIAKGDYRRNVIYFFGKKCKFCDLQSMVFSAIKTKNFGIYGVNLDIIENETSFRESIMFDIIGVPVIYVAEDAGDDSEQTDRNAFRTIAHKTGFRDANALGDFLEKFNMTFRL